MSADAPLICIVSPQLSSVIGIEEAEQRILNAARRLGAICARCVTYVDQSDIAQLGWWYGVGARVFITMDGQGDLYSFFNARPDAVLISSTPAPFLGLTNVFSFDQYAQTSWVSEAFDQASGTATGLADFAANGVWLDDGYARLLYFNTPPPAAYTYPLTTLADAQAIVADPIALGRITNASVVLIGRNPPEALLAVLAAAPTVTLLTPFLNPDVWGATIDNGGTVTFPQTIASHEFDKLAWDLFDRDTNSFVQALVTVADIGMSLLAIVRRRAGCGNACYMPEPCHIRACPLSKAGILAAIFNAATEDTFGAIPNVSNSI